MKAKQVVLVRRDTGERSTIPDKDLAVPIAKLLEDIQNGMYKK
jgi:hypothetical protein